MLERCYWSHREYDPLTVSLMTDGIEASVHSLTGHRPRVRADENGLLWLADAPSIDDLTAMATDMEKAYPLVIEQLQTYSEILNDLSRISTHDVTALEDLRRLINAYFSVHLLLHNTYEKVFISCRDLLLRDGVPPDIVTHLMSLTLTPPIIRWEASQKIETKKDLLAMSRQIRDLPALAPLEEKQFHESAVIDSLAQSPEARDLPAETVRYCRYTACVAVTKEWKFAMNKLLFSAFGEVAHTIASNLMLSTAETRLIPIDCLVMLARKSLV